MKEQWCHICKISRQNDV